MVPTIHKHYQLYMPNILGKNVTCVYNRKQESPVVGLSECLKIHNVSPFVSSYKDGMCFEASQGKRWSSVATLLQQFLSPDGDKLQGKCNLNAYQDRFMIGVRQSLQTTMSSGRASRIDTGIC
jgi:hypothetical protein